jgi:PAS domain-containing protein
MPTEAIVETITQPLLVLDGDLRVEAANPAFLRHFGVSMISATGSGTFPKARKGACVY